MSGATDLSEALIPSANMNCTDINFSKTVKRMEDPVLLLVPSPCLI